MATLRVEVVYARPGAQEVVRLELEQGATLRDALKASGLLQRYPRIDPDRCGVFGKAAAPETPLRDGDRVEIYRPLQADPKEARRRRASGRR